MTTQELITNYGLTFNAAELVAEYLREIDSDDMLDVFEAIYTVEIVCKKHSNLTDSPATCESLKSIYSALPYAYKKQYKDNYLLGYTNFLIKGEII